MGERIANILMHIESSDSSTHSLLANIYASANRWEDVKKVRRKMSAIGFKKSPGCSSIEVDGDVRQCIGGGNLYGFWLLSTPSFAMLSMSSRVVFELLTDRKGTQESCSNQNVVYKNKQIREHAGLSHLNKYRPGWHGDDGAKPDADYVFGICPFIHVGTSL
ncbi:hypothetical protein ACH5RR_005911 [Cinchona calisaya]|uniref:Pentatricopeptide repeat-containing protein n=1 Tax=Cinchona calisaya TaxID=153742 RepID=A0ABD3AMH6_9GENT